MTLSPLGLGTKNHCAGEGQQQHISQSAIQQFEDLESGCHVKAPRAVSIVMSPLGLGTKYLCAGEGQQHLSSQPLIQ
jgi:hypothetical protein